MVGSFLNGCIDSEDRLLAIEDLFDPDAEFRPEILGEVEIRAEIEQCSLTDFCADSIRFDQPVGKI